MKKITRITMLVALMALVSMMVSCSGGGGSSPSAVAKNFVQKIEKGDVDAAVKMLDGADEATAEEMEKMKAFLAEGTKQMAEKGGIKSIEVIDETINEEGNEAKVKTKIVYGDGTTDESSSNLVKKDKGWKVSMAK